MVERWFFVKENFLCYKKSQEATSISGVLDLKWARVEFEQVLDEQSGLGYYCAKIISNLKFTLVFIKREADMLKFESVLRGVSLFTDFRLRYETLGLIGQGNFGSVRQRKNIYLF